MIRSLIIFLVFGFVWLFIFSFPTKQEGVKVFDIANYHIIQNTAVGEFQKWLLSFAAEIPKK